MDELTSDAIISAIVFIVTVRMEERPIIIPLTQFVNINIHLCLLELKRLVGEKDSIGLSVHSTHLFSVNWNPVAAFDKIRKLCAA
jgi:hypothetical protein